MGLVSHALFEAAVCCWAYLIPLLFVSYLPGMPVLLLLLLAARTVGGFWSVQVQAGSWCVVEAGRERGLSPLERGGRASGQVAGGGGAMPVPWRLPPTERFLYRCAFHPASGH